MRLPSLHMHLHALLDDVFTGTAVLHIEANHDRRLIPEFTEVAIRIRPLDLTIEVALQDESAVSSTLVCSKFPLHQVEATNIRLTNLQVQHPTGAELRSAQIGGLTLSLFEPNELLADLEEPKPRSPLNDWLGAQPKPCSRLQLIAMNGSMTWQIFEPSANKRAEWIVQYCDAFPAHEINCTLDTSALPFKVEVAITDRGLLSVSGLVESALHEELFALALELAQGGRLTKLYDLKQDQLTLFRTSFKPPQPQFPLLRDPLPHQYQHAIRNMVDSLLKLNSEDFRKLRTACLFHLEAKKPLTYLEPRFLMAMIFVETRDESDDLWNENTSRLLGVDIKLAALFNDLRNQLIHGRGDFQKAYDLTVQKYFESNTPDLPRLLHAKNPGVEPLGLILPRLLERIDAYLWVLLIGKEQFDLRRFYPKFLGQMQLPEPYTGSEKPTKDPSAEEHELQNQIRLLKQKLKNCEDQKFKLNEQIVKQGQKIRSLKKGR
ncbi:hypothetical protein ACFIQF_23445 [Comamonas sp. J-3]